MSAIARYTHQVVILVEPHRGQWIKDMKAEYGVSEAQVARDCIELGSELLAKHYAKLGVRHPGRQADPVVARRTARKRKIDAGGSTTPQAEFLAPAGS